ncbi:DUF1304 family protein, partial [Leptospira interrogans serovar Pomona]|uniref:DUF1304 family protein n=1 Tax=Leptospira interrogans TaxID=173 RepID=UPI00187FD33E
PTIHRRFGVTDKKLAEAMKGVFLNQGFYNLFLAIGALYGAVFFELHTNYAPAIIQGLPPLIAIALIGFSIFGG